MRKRTNKLNFTVLSQDASKVVTKFRLSKAIIYIAVIIICIPVILSGYFFYENTQLEQENTELAVSLETKTDQATALEADVKELEDETSHYQSKMVELYELESQLRESLTELPVNLDSSGGVSIPLSDETLQEGQEEGLDYTSDALIERYELVLCQEFGQVKYRNFSA